MSKPNRYLAQCKTFKVSNKYVADVAEGLE